MSNNSERDPLIRSPSPEPPARLARERRLPSHLTDYHLGTPEESDSPHRVKSDTPPTAEGATATPERDEQERVSTAVAIETYSQGESEEEDDDEEDEQSQDVQSQGDKEMVPPDIVIPPDRSNPLSFQPGEFFVDRHHPRRPRSVGSHSSRSQHSRRTGSRRSCQSERLSVASALSEKLIQNLIDNQERARQDQERARQDQERARQDALAIQERARQDALAREERQRLEARADKERLERHAEALQRAAEQNLEIAKLALSRQPDPPLIGQPIPFSRPNSPHESERSRESRVPDPQPQSSAENNEGELDQRLGPSLDRSVRSPPPQSPSLPSQATRHSARAYDPLPVHPPGSIVPFFTQDDRENYREMRLSLEYLLGEPQACHSEQQKWLTLHIHCKLPIAKRLCFSHAKSPTPYTDSIRELDRRWGCPWDHILEEVEALGELPDIRSDAALDDYALRIRSLVTMLKLQGPTGATELNTGSTVERFIRKLPRHREERFRRHHDKLHPEKPTASLEELSDFLRDEVKHIRLPKKAEPKHSGQERSNRAFNRREGPVRVLMTIPEVEIKETKGAPSSRWGGSKKGEQRLPPPCPCCNESHWLERCPVFEKKNTEERKQWIKENKRCWRCAREHMAKQCTLKRPCRVKDCGRTHLTVLHDINIREDEPEEDLSLQDAPVDAEAAHTYYVGPVRGNSAQVLLKMVPVVLRHGDREMSTHAIIDDGSERTLLLKDAAIALGLKGQPHQMNILTIRPEPTPVAGEMVSLEIMPRGQPAEVHSLHNVFTAADLSLSKYGYPMRALTAKYPHLSELNLGQEEDVVPTILIGSDYAQLTLPRNILPGPNGCPVALDTPLGWTLQGPIDQEAHGQKKLALQPLSEASERPDELRCSKQRLARQLRDKEDETDGLSQETDLLCQEMRRQDKARKELEDQLENVKAEASKEKKLREAQQQEVLRLRQELDKKTLSHEEELVQREALHSAELKGLSKDLRAAESRQTSLHKELLVMRDRLDKANRERPGGLSEQLEREAQWQETIEVEVPLPVEDQTRQAHRLPQSPEVQFIPVETMVEATATPSSTAACPGEQSSPSSSDESAAAAARRSSSKSSHKSKASRGSEREGRRENKNQKRK